MSSVAFCVPAWRRPHGGNACDAFSPGNWTVTTTWKRCVPSMGLRRFDHPTLLLWGQHDTNFGPTIAERLAHDIPGVVRIEFSPQGTVVGPASRRRTRR